MAGSNVVIPGEWKSQTFTSSGTFNVPDGVSGVFIELYGGGGGGAFVLGTDQLASGGGGAKPVCTFVPVSPGGSVSVTIGAGGAPGGGVGGNGGDSSFGSVVARGAEGGRSWDIDPALPPAVFGSQGGFGNPGNRGTGGSPREFNAAFAGDGSYGNGGKPATGDASNPGLGATSGGFGAGGGSVNVLFGGVPGSGGGGICIVHYRQDF